MLWVRYASMALSIELAGVSPTVWLSAPFYAKMLGPLYYLSDFVLLLHLNHHHLLCVFIVLVAIVLGPTSGHCEVDPDTDV